MYIGSYDDEPATVARMHEDMESRGYVLDITDKRLHHEIYSDAMNLHLLCYHSGVSTFYGDNLLTAIADQAGWHEYSKKWFRKTLFDPSPIGEIRPSDDWTYEPSDHYDPLKKRNYFPNDGYQLIQGSGCVSGRLIGGHTGIMELEC